MKCQTPRERMTREPNAIGEYWSDASKLSDVPDALSSSARSAVICRRPAPRNVAAAPGMATLSAVLLLAVAAAIPLAAVADAPAAANSIGGPKHNGGVGLQQVGPQAPGVGLQQVGPQAPGVGLQQVKPQAPRVGLQQVGLSQAGQAPDVGLQRSGLPQAAQAPSVGLQQGGLPQAAQAPGTLTGVYPGGQRQSAASLRALSAHKVRGGRRDDYEEEYDDDDDDEIMDVSGAARLKKDDMEKLQPFLKDIEKLYSRGFRRSHMMRSKKNRDGWLSMVHMQRHEDQQLMAGEAMDKNATVGGEVQPFVIVAGRKPVNISALPYLLKQPTLTVQTRDLNRDDKVAFYMSVSFEDQVAFHWYLNGRPLEEYDSMQILDMNAAAEAGNKSTRSRVSQIEIEHLLKLPTSTGKYEINCTATVDYTQHSLKYVIEPQLTDDCPPANCYDRHAICRNGKCVCDSPYPVRLSSVHTTCRTESFLETPCHHHEQCQYTTNNSECLEQGWCACKRSFGRTPQHVCVKKSGVNSRCDSDNQCAVYNATCILSHCTCNSDSMEENDHCVVVSRSVNRLHSSSTAVQPRWAALALAGFFAFGGFCELLVS